MKKQDLKYLVAKMWGNLSNMRESAKLPSHRRLNKYAVDSVSQAQSIALFI